jgi:hypothetical protein
VNFIFLICKFGTLSHSSDLTACNRDKLNMRLLNILCFLISKFYPPFNLRASAVILLLTTAGPSLLAAGQNVNSAILPSVIVNVSLSTQTMKVYQDGIATHEWPVSTARPGKLTPKGIWTAKWLSRNHKSSRYNNAPMPYSIFYDGNFAVHGTDQIDRLGSPASAGCIRLHPENAFVLFSLVEIAGLKNTVIKVMN